MDTFFKLDRAVTFFYGAIHTIADGEIMIKDSFFLSHGSLNHWSARKK